MQPEPNRLNQKWKGPRKCVGVALVAVGLLMVTFVLPEPVAGQQQQQHHQQSPQEQPSPQQQQSPVEQHSMEQQMAAAYAAAAIAAAVAGNQQQQQHQQQISQHQPSDPTSLATSLPSALQSFSIQQQAASPRSRSPRSIGEMFKKLFNGNKRSKQSSGSTQSSSNRDWDQQQQLQQHQQQQYQQQQQLQMQQANSLALAAAAANQQAVYASPFSAYATAQPASAASLYSSQFSPYSTGGLVAWPTSAGSLALRAGPTLLTPAAPTSAAMGPLYTAASQSYSTYAVPPAGSGGSAAQSNQGLSQHHAAILAAQAAAAAGNPQPAASHAHSSAVPPPPGMGAGGHSGSGSSLDFHQVLDAFVRTSGFAPAGDQEAAAAQGYNKQQEGTPVFSFKKLVSLPFYLSTEEKPLDGLANAMAGSHGGSGGGGYSLHSMPIMRRHVRRMSSPTSQQQQQQQQYAAMQMADQRSEQAQYNSYLQSFNQQLASINANNRLISYLSQQVPQQQQMDSYSAADAAAALASYNQAMASLGGPATSASSSISPKSSERAANANLAMAASMVAPMAVQAPQAHHQSSLANQRQYAIDQQELQSLLNSMQQQLSAGDLYPAPSSPAAAQRQAADGHRFGSQHYQLLQPQQFSGWKSTASKTSDSPAAPPAQSQSSSPPSSSSDLSQTGAINSNNAGQPDYATSSGSNSASESVQNNAIVAPDHPHPNPHQQQQQLTSANQQAHQPSPASGSGASSSSSSSSSSLASPAQVDSISNTQQQAQQHSLINSTGHQQHHHYQYQHPHAQQQQQQQHHHHHNGSPQQPVGQIEGQMM